MAWAVAVRHESCAMRWAPCCASYLFLSAEWPGCHAAHCWQAYWPAVSAASLLSLCHVDSLPSSISPARHHHQGLHSCLSPCPQFPPCACWLPPFICVQTLLEVLRKAKIDNRLLEFFPQQVR